MNGSIALGWLLATVLFALIGNATLTVVFLIFAVFFGFMSISGSYQATKQILIKGEKDE
jgi:capsular polysaccharide biosynthesis protein